MLKEPPTILPTAEIFDAVVMFPVALILCDASTLPVALKLATVKLLVVTIFPAADKLPPTLKSPGSIVCPDAPNSVACLNIDPKGFPLTLTYCLTYIGSLPLSAISNDANPCSKPVPPTCNLKKSPLATDAVITLAVVVPVTDTCTLPFITLAVMLPFVLILPVTLKLFGNVVLPVLSSSVT